MNYLDWGFARALGKVGGFIVKSEATGHDVTDAARSNDPDGPDAFDLRLAGADLELNRWVLDGPTREEERVLPGLGYDPMATHKVQLERAAQEMEQVARFNADPSWRGPRIRDIIVAREIIIEIKDIFERGVDARGADLETVLAKTGPNLSAFDLMPSFDVSVSLKTEFHRNPQHRWKPNHIQDIDALAETIPYCDIVVTDKEAAAHLVQTGTAERLNTTVLSRVTDLILHL